jgi:hypothetical protein
MGLTIQDLNPGRKQEIFLLLQDIHTGYVAHPAYYSMGTRVLSWGKVARA